MKPLRILLLVCLFSTWLTASNPSDADLESRLSAMLVGKIITIRNFYVPADLEYKADGTIKRSSELQGSWTIYGEMIPDRVEVKDKKVTIKGSRLIVMFRSKELKPVYGRGSKVTLDIDRDGSHDPMDAVAKVFIGGGDKLSDLAPPYWRQYLRYREAHPDGGSVAELRNEVSRSGGGDSVSKPVPSSVDEVKTPEKVTASGDEIFVLPTTADEEGLGNVARVGGDVLPPRATSTPDPKYNEYARLNKYQATCTLWLVVQPDGKPSNIQIVRPAGFGLDEEAVATVERWKFSPATKNGNPIPVQINVQVNFHLY